MFKVVICIRVTFVLLDNKKTQTVEPLLGIHFIFPQQINTALLLLYRSDFEMGFFLLVHTFIRSSCLSSLRSVKHHIFQTLPLAWRSSTIIGLSCMYDRCISEVANLFAP